MIGFTVLADDCEGPGSFAGHVRGDFEPQQVFNHGRSMVKEYGFMYMNDQKLATREQVGVKAHRGDISDIARNDNIRKSSQPNSFGSYRWICSPNVYLRQCECAINMIHLVNWWTISSMSLWPESFWGHGLMTNGYINLSGGDGSKVVPPLPVING